MARTEGQWKKGIGLITPAENVPVLLRNEYLNFGGATIGESGYGVRDNSGTLQFKNNGGSWTNFGAGGGAATFLDLTDTPSAYTGQAGKFPKVNAGEDALEFAAVPGGGDMLASTYDPAGGAKQVAFAADLGTAALADTTDFAPALGADDNYVTDAEKTKLANLSGTNTGDQDLSGYLTSATAASTYEPIKGADDNYVTDAEKAALHTHSNKTVLDNTTASFVTAQETKLGHISVTQAVNLDAIETRVNALDAAVVLKGTWDASAGTFPGGGTAQAGDSYIVSVGGTVDSQVFVANDRIIAILDNASTTTFASNWFKADYTDAVLSIDNATGAVSLSTILAGKTGKTTPVDADTLPINNSADSNNLFKVTWANIKATLKTYFDTLYQASGTYLIDIVSDTSPQLGGDLDANGKNITDIHELRIDSSPDTDDTANGPTTDSKNAGATISAFEAVYMASDGEWAKTDASATATADKALAIALAAGTDGNAMKVALPGAFIRNDDWNWTVGGAVYLSETAGALTQTAPTTADAVVRVVGYAYTADVLWFMPETGVVHA